MTVACNPVISFSSGENIKVLRAFEWCIFWANDIISASTHKKISWHRFLVIPITDDRVILFSIISDVDGCKERYDKYNQKDKKKGLLEFRKEDYPPNTFDEKISAANLNSCPIEMSIEDISQRQLLHRNCLTQQEKDAALGFLLERDDLTGNIKNALMQLYCKSA